MLDVGPTGLVHFWDYSQNSAPKELRWVTGGQDLYFTPVGSQRVSYPYTYCLSPGDCGYYRITLDLSSFCNGQMQYISYRFYYHVNPYPNYFAYRRFQCTIPQGSQEPPETPLIFIPGIAGSTLYDVNASGNPVNNLWLSGILFPSRLTKLSLNPNNAPFPTVVPVDIVYEGINIASHPIKPVYRPLINYLDNDLKYEIYDIEGNPKKRDVECTGEYSGQKPSLFIFSYDWRKSNVEAASKLRDFIDCVNTFYPGEKVNILTHSMGGLVARRYILNNPGSHRVNKLITTVAPWLGTSKAIDTTLTGRFLGPFLGFYAHTNAVKNIVQFGEGPHQLLPSEAYFNRGGKPFAYQGPLSLTPKEYSFSETFEYINQRFPNQPYVNNFNFHNVSGQDNWAADSSGVKYYHLIGQQNCDKTISQVIVAPYTNFPLDVDKLKYGVKLKYGKGDGTVFEIGSNRPVTMQAPRTALNKILSPTNSNSCSEDNLYDHTGILGNPELHSELRISLSEYNRTPQSSTKETISEIERESESSSLVSEGMNYLSITGVNRLNIFDAQGNTNASINADADVDVSGVRYDYGSNVSDSFIVPHEVSFITEKTVDVKFTALNEKISIEILRGFNPATPSTVKKYLDLQLPSNVTGLLKFSSAGVENLRYDADGDGTFETEVQPSVNLTGASASDKTPPTIDVSYTVNDNEATVMVSAADNGTGVKQIRYIVNGATGDHIYNSPFTVNLSQSQLIYVSAEDNAGNRNVLAKWLDNTSPITMPVISNPNNSSGWSNNDTPVTLRAKDNLGGSGVKSLAFSGNGAQTIPAGTITNDDNPLTFPQPSGINDVVEKNLLVTQEGITTLTFFAKDKANNVETTNTYDIKIDRNPPLSQHTSSSSNNEINFSLTATDALSGVDKILYSIDGGAVQKYVAPFIVSGLGTHVVSYYAQDIAGNTENSRVVYINKATAFDFDGDRKTDVSVFRPTDSTWYLNQSINGFTAIAFGLSTDRTVPADYDGDGKTDIAVYRGGTWYLQRSSAGFTGMMFGQSTDIPQPADFDGNGFDDLAVFRPSTGVWYVHNLATNQYTAFTFGQNGDKPVVSDYDGDGKADYAFNRAGTWFIQRSTLGFISIAFGNSNDKPVPADYTGDGKTDVAVFRLSTGEWHILRSEDWINPISYAQQFGINGDVPIPGDYDGDGKVDVAVFRPSTGVWHLMQSANGTTQINFGLADDIPLPSSFIP